MVVISASSPEGLERRGVGLGRGRTAGVADHEDAVAQVGCGPGGAFHGGVGGHAEEDDGLDSQAPQHLVEFAVVESADALVGHDVIGVLGREFVDDRRAGGAVDQAVLLDDDVEQG